MKRIYIFALLMIFYGSGYANEEKCTTPNGEIGKCIHINKCEQFKSKDTLTSTEEFFLKLSIKNCGKPEDQIICCGRISDFKQINTAMINEAELEYICGETTVGDRIVEGNLAGIDEFPWMAILQYKNTQTNYKFYGCGGSLINNRYVLTAAHCLLSSSELFMVRLGDWNYTSPEDCDYVDTCNSPIDVEIDEIIPHEKYNITDLNRHNDIGLIRLKTIVQFTDYIKPICIPKNDDINLTDNFVVAGWGIYNISTRQTSDVLLKTNILISDKCGLYKVDLSKDQICAGGQRNSDSCSGDSGGPLMKLIHAKYYAYGLISFGPVECGKNELPSIHIKVFSYIDWIKRHIWV